MVSRIPASTAESTLPPLYMPHIPHIVQALLCVVPAQTLSGLSLEGKVRLTSLIAAWTGPIRKASITARVMLNPLFIFQI
jgi:hypothetical protein